VETQLVREHPAEQVYTSTRARIIALLGPLTVVAGIIWAIIQPSRLTLLHPHGQGFWWLVIEAPLLVAIAGLVFAFFVARPLVAELEGDDGAA
jgi:ABC-type amino acid transport system permease subunit